MTKSQGRLFIISSPSGGGKSTIIKELLTRDTNLTYSISATTRPPRQGEVNGKDYFFLNESTFQNKIDSNAFLEWKDVHGHRYGTLKEQISQPIEEGYSVLLDFDVKGGMDIK